MTRSSSDAAKIIIGDLTHSEDITYVSGPITSGILSYLDFPTRMQVNCKILSGWAERVADWFPHQDGVIDPGVYQSAGDLNWEPHQWDDMWREVIHTVNINRAVLTPGWTRSNGCRAEIKVLLEIGASFYLASDIGPIDISAERVKKLVYDKNK